MIKKHTGNNTATLMCTMGNQPDTSLLRKMTATMKAERLLSLNNLALKDVLTLPALPFPGSPLTEEGGQ